jgi:hypothetical protein
LNTGVGLLGNVAGGFLIALVVGGGIFFYDISTNDSSTIQSSSIMSELTSSTPSGVTKISSTTQIQVVQSSSTTQSYAYSKCPDGLRTIAINGIDYCTDDVTAYTIVQNPGYTYFTNRSILFMSVVFATICPPYYAGCPSNSSSNQTTTVIASAIKFTLMFPDHSNETIGDVIGTSTQVIILSAHMNPRAGAMIIRTGAGYDVLLLVQANS